MSPSKKIIVKGIEVNISTTKQNDQDYISLTDIAKHKNAEATGAIIANWLRTRYTIEFMGIWEQIHNPSFNVLDFEYIKNQSGSNSFTISTKQWIEKTKAIGLTSKSGRHNSGTFAHKDIAFEFASCISPEFKLYSLNAEFIRQGLESRERLKKLN